MPLITRATLPENFFDVTSSMLLTAPEPQYLYCELWKSALGASLGDIGALGTNSPFPSAGASPGSFESMRLRLADPISSEAITVVPELGKGAGHTVKVNRPHFPNSTYTLASRTVPSGATISTTPINLSSEQTAITLLRIAGPYGASAVQPYGVDRFDASVGVHKLADLVGKHLKRDFDKTIDSIVASFLDAASSAVYPVGMSAVNDATDANAYNLTYEQIVRVERTMNEANVPLFPNGRRALVLTPKQVGALKLESNFMRLVRYFPQTNPVLAAGYIGSVGMFDVFVSNTLAQTNNSSSVPIQYGHAFGPGVLLSGVGDLPRVAFNNQNNYDEWALVIWLMYAGFALSDSRFVVSVRST